MKGICLCGGTGSRLLPLTKVTSKHLLHVGNKPMIDHPIEKLIAAGIDDILVVTGTEHAGAIFSYLGSGKERGCDFTYRIQDRAGGIAEALGLARGFVNGDRMVVLLGDNVIEDDITPFVANFADQKRGARVLLKPVPDPERFGVADLSIDGNVVSIEEKPRRPKTKLAVIGCYMYDAQVFDIIAGLKPSARGELEITSVNNEYIRREELQYDVVRGYWSDAGTHESLSRANDLVRGRVQ